MKMTATRPFTYHAAQPFKLDCQRVSRHHKWAVVTWPTGEISRN
ncbi:hypothetical protein ES703_49774 [subsurface metagenome]